MAKLRTRDERLAYVTFFFCNRRSSSTTELVHCATCQCEFGSHSQTNRTLRSSVASCGGHLFEQLGDYCLRASDESIESSKTPSENAPNVSGCLMIRNGGVVRHARSD